MLPCLPIKAHRRSLSLGSFYVCSQMVLPDEPLLRAFAHGMQPGDFHPVRSVSVSASLQLGLSLTFSSSASLVLGFLTLCKETGKRGLHGPRHSSHFCPRTLFSGQATPDQARLAR